LKKNPAEAQPDFLLVRSESLEHFGDFNFSATASSIARQWNSTGLAARSFIHRAFTQQNRWNLK